MRKLYYMGLEPYEARYTLQLQDWNTEAFEKRKLDYVVVPGDLLTTDQSIVTGQVLDAHGRSYFGMSQMMSLVKLMKEGEVTSNLLTYAFGFDLTNEYEGIKPNLVNIEGQDYISFTFSRRTSDDALDYQIQLSLDGVNWSNGINEILKVEEKSILNK